MNECIYSSNFVIDLKMINIKIHKQTLLMRSDKLVMLYYYNFVIDLMRFYSFVVLMNIIHELRDATTYKRPI